MDPLVGEIVKWVPGSLLGAAVMALLVYVAKQFLARITALEEAVKALTEHIATARAQAENRVTVPDFRESMRQVWDARSKDREEFIELRTEMRIKKTRR